MRLYGGQVYITRKIIPADYATFVRDYARGNLDEAELWEELTTLGYSSSEIEWHIANPGRCWGSKGTPIGNFPPERQDAARRWLKERVVLAKVAEQLIAEAGAELPAELN
jgi:hypothetical protein